MNILFYLVPKSDVIFIYDDYSLRQTMEKMERYHYTSVPMIDRNGRYIGSLTEGDVLREIRKREFANMKEVESFGVRQVPRYRDNRPININCKMEDLISTAMNQNFVPVVDDHGIFIGIVTRKCIISYFYEKLQDISGENLSFTKWSAGGMSDDNPVTEMDTAESN